MRARSWRWLRARILGLLTVDNRITRHFNPPEEVSSGAQHR